MDFEKMMEMFKMFAMFSQMSDVFGTSSKKEEPKKKEPKKKEDMTAKERLDALEELYAKKDEENTLIKRIEELEKKAPKVNADVADPAGIDDIIKGLVPGLLRPDKEDK